MLIQRLEGKGIRLPHTQKYADQHKTLLLQLFENGKISEECYSTEVAEIERLTLDDETMLMFKEAISQ